MKFSRSTLLSQYFACDELERSPKLAQSWKKSSIHLAETPSREIDTHGHYVDNDTTLGAWYDYLGSKETTYDQQSILS